VHGRRVFFPMVRLAARHWATSCVWRRVSVLAVRVRVLHYPVRVAGFLLIVFSAARLWATSHRKSVAIVGSARR
jgi:hypothetical protein